MSRQLDGRVAVVTGAGRGIGRATAVALAREGADVACVARTASQLAETAALVRAAGRRAQQIEADIGEPGAPSLIAAKVLAELGTVDILVNNAATVEPAGPTATAGPQDWARAVAVNLTGPVRLTLAVLGGMIEQGYGRIVNVSSGIAADPGASPGLNAYAASKAALEAHTLGLAAELAGTGVTVNIVRPGPVDTAMPGLDPGPATRPDRHRTARPVRGDARRGPHGLPRPASQNDRRPRHRRHHGPDRQRQQPSMISR